MIANYEVSTKNHMPFIYSLLSRFILPENMDLRDEIARGQNRADFWQTTLKIRERYAAIHDGEVVWNHINSGTCSVLNIFSFPHLMYVWVNPAILIFANCLDYNLTLPPWICQPWVRMAPEDYVKKMKEVQDRVMKLQQEEEVKKCRIIYWRNLIFLTTIPPTECSFW